MGGWIERSWSFTLLIWPLIHDAMKRWSIMARTNQAAVPMTAFYLRRPMKASLSAAATTAEPAACRIREKSSFLFPAPGWLLRPRRGRGLRPNPGTSLRC